MRGAAPPSSAALTVAVLPMRPLVTTIIARLLVFLAWNLLSVGVLLLPIHPAGRLAAELLIVAAFARRYLLRRRQPRDAGTRSADARAELARRAALRLRAVPRSAWRVLAVWTGATVVLDVLLTLVYLHVVPAAADIPNPFAALGDHPVGWLAIAVAVVAAAPFMEEVAFRGWVQRPLERRFGAVPAIGVTALLFALAHGERLLIGYFLVSGLVLGVSVWLTRSLWASVTVHAAHNLASLALDGVGLTNARVLPWTRDPAVVLLAAVALAACVVVMFPLARRLQEATARPGTRARPSGVPAATVAANAANAGGWTGAAGTAPAAGGV